MPQSYADWHKRWSSHRSNVPLKRVPSQLRCWIRWKRACLTWCPWLPLTDSTHKNGDKMHYRYFSFEVSSYYRSWKLKNQLNINCWEKLPLTFAIEWYDYNSMEEKVRQRRPILNIDKDCSAAFGQREIPPQ